jgi:predicted ABC-type ATPase
VSEEVPAGIYVLAGPNGAGKSSIGGAILEASGGQYFNPDEQTRRVLAQGRIVDAGEANSFVWHQMVRALDRAIDERAFFAFETTLGGSTITGKLLDAAQQGADVRIWYVALASADAHIARVRVRVATGGHDIDDDRIRARYVTSRLHLIELLPYVSELYVYDNSVEIGIADDDVPEPLLILHMLGKSIVECCDLSDVPAWAKPIYLRAVQVSRSE